MTDQIPHGPDNLVCPFHNKYMSKVCHKCPLWVKIVGKNPQSMEQVDKWNCSFSFMPMLLIENTQMTRGTGVAIESFRNEVIARSTAPVNNPELLAMPSGDQFEDKFIPRNNSKSKLIGK